MNRIVNSVCIGLAMMVSATGFAQTGPEDLSAFGLAGFPKADAAGTINTTAAGEETVVYGGDPVDIVLAAGRTQRVVFDFVGHIGVPADMASHLDIKTLPSGIFLTARAPFEANVVQVRNADNTRVIPIYLSAIESADPAYSDIPDRITVVDGTRSVPSPPPVTARAPDPVVITPPTVSAAPKEPPLDKKVVEVIPRARSRSNTGLIDFVRMLAQQHYGPARLAGGVSGAEAIKLDDTQSVRLIPGARVETTPVSSWSWRNYVGTAIDIRNPGDRDYAIDPRQFVGYWRYAAVLDRRSVIKPGESAVVFLVSDRPFEQAMRGVVWKGVLK